MVKLRDFLMKGLIGAAGQIPEYKIRLNAAGWVDKGVLTEADIDEIQEALEAEPKAEIDSEGVTDNV